MSNWIHVQGEKNMPINLDLVRGFENLGTNIRFYFGPHDERSWNFSSEYQTEMVYNELLDKLSPSEISVELPEDISVVL
jgi:hypothetical protein